MAANRTCQSLVKLARSGLAQSATPRVFYGDVIGHIITRMTLLELMVQVVFEWARAVLVDILGYHTEHFVAKRVRRFKKKKSRKRKLDNRDRR